ncbi:MAG TPA: 16S rRNA (adenine(1518)-N(6)/adenine(1519)-N(6))-dimethyltransferase RsmA [Anaerolineae bacterium]|nr:16S rRNA (adenine(1518)-N(6)/adenine(1519)-N(6))-dimethyltransferase RsmA [Anaerolineae bacterium]
MGVRRLLREFDLQPKKGLGQNFLVSEGALRRIVAAADLEPGDVVLEVGPGLGTLTRLLAQQAEQVIAVELDQRLVEILSRTLADFPNVEIVQGDILEMEPGGAGGLGALSSGYKVVANLPYYITSAVLRHLLTARVKPQLIVVTVQREVAQRMIAGPGQMSLLSVSVQFYGRPRIVARIPAGAFYPVPKVNSAVVRIDLYESPPVAVADVDRFFEVVRAGFGQRRKQLRNALAQGLSLPVGTVVEALRRAGVDEKRRAQTLSLEEWVRVVRGFSGEGKTKPALRPQSPQNPGHACAKDKADQDRQDR